MAASHLNKTVKICILLCGSFAIYNIIFGTLDDRKSEEDTAKFRDLSLNLGNGDCKWQPVSPIAFGINNCLVLFTCLFLTCACCYNSHSTIPLKISNFTKH